MSKTCPPVRVNMKPVVDAAAAKVMGELTQEGLPSVHAVARVTGLGKMIGFIPERFDGTEFVMGYVTIPSVVNLATKMAQVGIIFPQVDLAISRGAALIITLVSNVLVGGSSFLLGSFLGQFPTTLDAVGDVAVGAIAKARGVAVVPTMLPQNRIGATAEERELKLLRQNLEKLSGGDGQEEMAGAELVVR
jgi:hypothetical protein